MHIRERSFRPFRWHRAHLPLLCAAIGLTACGGQSDSSTSNQSHADTPFAKSFTRTIRKLETVGVYPLLDRSDDLLGPDKDNNGIRDDIDAIIDRQGYPESQKKAVQQLARYEQTILHTDLKDQKAVWATLQLSVRAIHCVASRLPSSQWEDSVEKYKSLTMNTKARALTYDAFGQTLSGRSWSLPNGDTCDS